MIAIVSVIAGLDPAIQFLGQKVKNRMPASIAGLYDYV